MTASAILVALLIALAACLGLPLYHYATALMVRAVVAYRGRLLEPVW